MTYADTSFVVPLYLAEGNSKRAIEIVDQLSAPLPVTPLLLLEFRNALNLAIKRKEITFRERDEIWRSFEKDTNQGEFFRVAVSPEALNRVASELSDRHSPKVGTRSLDLLHLAAAQILGAETFLTFDVRQAEAGKLEGFKILR